MKTLNIFRKILLGVFWLPALLQAENTLPLDAAIQLALEADPLVKSHSEQISAFEDYSLAADSWADPKIKLGLLSLPTDSLELDQEPMTQLVLGYQQSLPRGNTVEHESGHLKAKAFEKRADLDLRQRMVRMSVRKTWLKVYLYEQSEKIIQKNRRLFKQQLNVSQSLYASGRNQQQDVLQAELELSLLDDQLQQMSSKIKEARSLLSQWVGRENSNLPLQVKAQQFNQPLNSNIENLIARLGDYPLMAKYRAKEFASREQLDLAKQKYKPQWGFDISYAKRSGENMDGSDRSDFVSTMINFDLPVFTGQKQDKVVSARQKQLLASKYEKQDAYLQAVSQLEQFYARWQQLRERVGLYDRQVLKQAKQNATAALNGYQSGVVSFITLTRARSAELKAELQRLNLVVEQSIAHADIRYLVGDV
ncbi:MAG: TolC family protein [Gammaproteobacteria bacterium]|nr:TolC family protein [Gammaproteobacteria bacterium]MCW9003873.1 TolC family protein [Gammaproteobacteria bacterium]MCW9055162.1 TolC family protein [Gammaproteobacteria bacterium]